MGLAKEDPISVAFMGPFHKIHISKKVEAKFLGLRVVALGLYM
jgi:hypothetical protein